jgi:predicted amidohydrolase YtcJ
MPTFKPCARRLAGPSPAIGRLIVWGLVSLLVGCAGAPSEGPDLVITGGAIYPLGDSDSPVGALAIRGDSILAIGSRAEILALVTENTQVMELDEECVLPGFFDAWIDPLALGRWSAAPLDLRLATTLEEVQAMVRNASAGGSGDEWLLGWGWNESLWPDPVLPTHEALDAVAADRPVALFRRAGKVAWLNQAALQSADLAEQDGVLRGSDGSPSGILLGAAVDALEARIPGIDPQQRQEWISRGLHLAAAMGLTSVATAPLNATAISDYVALERDGMLPVRVRMRLSPGSAESVEVAERPLLRLAAVGAHVDGPFTARLAALDEPYADLSTEGFLQMSADELSQAAELANARGLPLHLHAQGDRAVALALEALAGTDHAGMLVGADLPPAGWLETARGIDLTVALVPLRFAHDVYWLEQRLGQARSERSHRWREILASGTPWAIASDAPAYPLEPFGGILTLTTRRNAEGYPASGWYPEQGVGRSMALRATIGPEGLAPDAVLSPGAPADIVIWSEDPFASEANDDTLRRTEVLLTIVAGRVVYSRALVSLPASNENGSQQ